MQEQNKHTDEILLFLDTYIEKLSASIHAEITKQSLEHFAKIQEIVSEYDKTILLAFQELLSKIEQNKSIDEETKELLKKDVIVRLENHLDTTMQLLKTYQKSYLNENP